MPNGKKTKSTKMIPPPMSSGKGIQDAAQCPTGSHRVRAHPLSVPPSKKNPTGIATRKTHCARNPASGKVSFGPKDIKKIENSDKFRSKRMPCALNSTRDESNSFDDLIAGWTQYWNDVFKS